MGMGGSKHRYTQRIEYTTNTLIRRLTYEETLQVLMSEGHDVNAVINDALGFGTQLGLRDFDSERGLFGIGGTIGKIQNAVVDTIGKIPIVGDIVGGIFSAFGGGSKKRVAVDYEESGWELQRKWLEVLWDRAAYRLGIDEVAFLSYAFEEAGEFVSTTFRSPLPIRKISLTADQSIPKAFTQFDPTFPWIRYFVSIDGGKTFIPIAPEEASVLRGDDNEDIKQFINLNSGIAEEDRDVREEYIDTELPVFEVRFRAIFTRPTDIPDANNYTPILRSYRLKLFPDTTQSGLDVTDERGKDKTVTTKVNA